MTRVRFVAMLAALALVTVPGIAGPGGNGGGCGQFDVTGTVTDNGNGTLTFTYEVCFISGHALSHFNIPFDIGCIDVVAATSGGEAAGAPTEIGTDPTCGTEGIKFDAGWSTGCATYTITVAGDGGAPVYSTCGSVTIKAGTDCCSFDGGGTLPVPTCDINEANGECAPTGEECNPEATGWTLTQGAWGSAKHYEAWACSIISGDAVVAGMIQSVAECYGFTPGDDLGMWVTGDCGLTRGSDGGFVPSGFEPGQNGASQLIAAILNVYGVGQVGPDWYILSTGEQVGDVIAEALQDPCNVSGEMTGKLGTINESWDEGVDNGTVSPCPPPGT